MALRGNSPAHNHLLHTAQAATAQDPSAVSAVAGVEALVASTAAVEVEPVAGGVEELEAELV